MMAASGPDSATAANAPVETRVRALHVSVIIPAYNAVATIGETLESLLAQTHPHWEAIVVDDGSSDNTSEVASRYAAADARIRVVRRPNGGESAARNTGIAEARHDWLLFLDSDDWIAPTHLERMTDELTAEPRLDAVHCGYARVAHDGTLVPEKYQPPAGDMFPTLAQRAAFPVHTCVVRRALVEEVGGFDLALQKSADWDLWQRIARSGARFGAVRDLLAYYRMQPNSASLDARQLLLDGLRVLERGRSCDPRVPNPCPPYTQGWQEGRLQDQRYYLLCWCAGLLIGRGQDARPLVELIESDGAAELYPDAIAQCVFESAPLSTCRPPACWDALWVDVSDRIDEFLAALERHSKTPNLASRAAVRLKEMVLANSLTWGPVIGELQRALAILREDRDNMRRLAEERGESNDQLQKDNQWLQSDREHWQDLANERESNVSQAQQQIEVLTSERNAILTEREATVAQLQQQIEVLTSERNAILTERERTVAQLQQQIQELASDRNAILFSPERKAGDFLLNRLHLKRPVLATAAKAEAARHRLVTARLATESRLLGSRNQLRMLATVCSNFPIYSQTFVYQELTQLMHQGFALRLIYSQLDSKANLPTSFSRLWRLKRRLHFNRVVHERDFARYRARMPEKVEALIEKLCQASGLSRQALVSHDNFLQAFSFTRLVEAYRPHYLHSYFFYDRSLMALVAGWLLDIPRGVSCYTDHMLHDYELKLVPLHLELCDVVVATSNRIKQELLAIAPATDPQKILVKPNGIDTESFPVVDRVEPLPGQPFRIVTVCRIEPKKGLLELVEAVHLLRQRGMHVEAHIVGAADEWSESSRAYKQKLDQRISELNLWGTVHLEGQQNLEGIRRFQGMAHLFVAPFVETESGDKDGIPTALLEGMATGLPAVATNAGSICEVVGDGHDGAIVAQRNPAALAEAIDDLLRDPLRRRRLGQHAARKVRESFDILKCETIFHERVHDVIRINAG